MSGGGRAAERQQLQARIDSLEATIFAVITSMESLRDSDDAVFVLTNKWTEMLRAVLVAEVREPR